MTTANREIIKEALLREFKRISIPNNELIIFQVMFDGYRIGGVENSFEFYSKKGLFFNHQIE